MVVAEAAAKGDQSDKLTADKGDDQSVDPAAKLSDTATDQPAGQSETAAVTTNSSSALEPPAPPKISKNTGNKKKHG